MDDSWRLRGRAPRVAAVLAVGLLIASGARLVADQAGQKSALDGVYTVEQAKRGEAAYAAECVECHLADLSGTDRGPALAGDTFLRTWTDRSVGALFDRTYKTMPQDRPGTLTAEMTRDIVAFLLRANDYPAGAVDLPVDAAVLETIRIRRNN